MFRLTLVALMSELLSADVRSVQYVNEWYLVHPLKTKRICFI
jgi:hypothetical protein